ERGGSTCVDAAGRGPVCEADARALVRNPATNATSHDRYMVSYRLGLGCVAGAQSLSFHSAPLLAAASSVRRRARQDHERISRRRLPALVSKPGLGAGIAGAAGDGARSLRSGRVQAKSVNKIVVGRP